jgi:hypothetical protein
MTRVSTAQSWGITAGLPIEHVVALKNGFFPLAGRGWRLGSTGVVKDDAGGAYAVTILTDGNPTESSGIALVEAISRHVDSELTVGNPVPGAVDDVVCLEAYAGQSWSTVSTLLGETDAVLVQHVNGGEPAPLSGQRICSP